MNEPTTKRYTVRVLLHVVGHLADRVVTAVIRPQTHGEPHPFHANADTRKALARCGMLSLYN